jgi:DNA-binding NarL/FixJ family response regulator
MAVHRKLDTVLQRLQPDVLVLSECADEATLAAKYPRPAPWTSMAWIGKVPEPPKNPDKGLAVLRLLAEGHSNQEIAKRASLSVKSVERWLERIYREMKLDTDGSVNLRVAAVRRYLKETGQADRG